MIAGIAGEVYDDILNPGIKDRGEGGLGGWLVFIDKEQDGSWNWREPWAITSSSGGYFFPDIGPGLYYVHVIGPDGFELTTNNVIQVLLDPGRSNHSVDFGGRLTTLS